MPDLEDAEVRSLLDRWVFSTRVRDVDEQVDCYAPVVKLFNGEPDVNHDEIYREKKKQFQTIGTVHRYDIDNLQITKVDPKTAVVVFDKNWDFGDHSKFTGSERAQLTLNRIDGKWKITSERQLKLYRMEQRRATASPKPAPG